MNWYRLKIRATAFKIRVITWLKPRLGRVKCLFIGHDTAVRYSPRGRAKARVVRYDGAGSVLYSCYRCQNWVHEGASHEANSQNH